jgi:hypothetical protein
MIASIHQPNYLPYIGFFNKIKSSDIFVILDIAQYVKNDFHNRNRIKGPSGEFWLTIPIHSKECYLKRIIDVPLPQDNRWAVKHLRSISQSYKKAPYYDKYIGFFEKLYMNPPNRLAELNERIILFLLKCFNIKTKIIKASELNLPPDLKSTEMLIEILKKIRADIYISGKGREGKKHYLDEELMKKEGIKIKYHDFQHPIYNQLYNGFIKNLSAIDLLFNCGEKAGGII